VRPRNRKRAEARAPFARIAAAGARGADAAPLDLALHTYAAKWQCFDQLTTAFVLQAFRDLGVFAAAGERRLPDEIVGRYAILPVYAKVVRRWLKRLAASGFLRETDGAFEAPVPLPPAALDRLRAAAAPHFSDAPELLEYVERSGRRIVPVLTGKGSSLENLFPGGSFAIAESMYEKSASARYFNSIVRSLVESAAAGSSPAQRLRVLEIGAGTGGTTAAVLPALAPERTAYHFTDMSQLFLLRGEDRFREYPFVRYSLLDIERDPVGQGVAAHAFDVIVATNVLHATRDLRETLTHVRSLLAPGGVLLLNEATNHPGWFDLGLVEGWERYDDDLRTDGPVLSVEGWSRVLREQGFEHVAAFPGSSSPAGILGQHVIAAGVAADGTVAADADADPESRSLAAGSDVAGVAGQASDRASVVLLRSVQEGLPEERTELVINYVRDHVAAVLRLPDGERPGPRQRLMDLGLDSLMAVELRNRLASGLNLDRSLPATLMFDYPTIEAMAGYLERAVLGFDRPSSASAAARQETSAAAARLEELSEEEAEALLLEKLGKL
jgi:SAM-dependent methyltransferase